jgi:hypothetical protein
MLAQAVDTNPANRPTSFGNILGSKKNYDIFNSVIEDMGMKLGVSADQPVDGVAAFGHAMQTAIAMSLINPEAAGQIVSQLKSIQSPEDKGAARMKGQAGQAEDAAAKAGEEFGKAKAAHKNKVQELFEAQELQSWHSIVAFIALSMFIGPKMAFLFFSNAKQKGLLKYELEQIKGDGRKAHELQAQKTQEARQYRGEAAKLQLGGQMKQDDRRWAVMRDQQKREEQHAMRMDEIEARAVASGASGNPEYKKVKYLVGIYNQRARIAIAQAKDSDRAELYGTSAKGSAAKFREEAARQNELAEDAIGILLEMIK